DRSVPVRFDLQFDVRRSRGSRPPLPPACFVPAVPPLFRLLLRRDWLSVRLLMRGAHGFYVGDDVGVLRVAGELFGGVVDVEGVFVGTLGGFFDRCPYVFGERFQCVDDGGGFELFDGSGVEEGFVFGTGALAQIGDGAPHFGQFSEELLGVHSFLHFFLLVRGDRACLAARPVGDDWGVTVASVRGQVRPAVSPAVVPPVARPRHGAGGRSGSDDASTRRAAGGRHAPSAVRVGG